MKKIFFAFAIALWYFLYVGMQTSWAQNAELYKYKAPNGSWEAFRVLQNRNFLYYYYSNSNLAEKELFQDKGADRDKDEMTLYLRFEDSPKVYIFKVYRNIPNIVYRINPDGSKTPFTKATYGQD